MARFKITQTQPATEQWEYEVEARDQQDALEQVLNGSVDPSNYIVEADDDAEERALYEIEEIDEEEEEEAE